MTEILVRTYKNTFFHERSQVDRLSKNLERERALRKKFLKDLTEVIPQQRQEIKRKAKELYDLAREYREKGFDRKYAKFINEASREIKKLKAINRFNTMRVIHKINLRIRELKTRIEHVKSDQLITKEDLKEALFQELVNF